MASACVTLKANTHLANSEKGFLGERIKVGFNNSALVMNQLAIRSRSHKRVKHGVGVVSSVLTSNNAKESLVS